MGDHALLPTSAGLDEDTDMGRSNGDQIPQSAPKDDPGNAAAQDVPAVEKNSGQVWSTVSAAL